MSNPAPIPEPALGLAQAASIVDGALAEARRREFQPLTVVVLDAGGHLLCAKREDHSGILRFEIAFGKAWGALGMGRSSRDLEAMSKARPVFVTTLASVAGGRFVPVAGGALILDANGRVVGAAAASGDTSDADEQCVLHGIAAAGFAFNPAAA